MNLLDLLKQIFGGNFAALASNVLGESESNTKSAVTSMIPALLGSLVQKGSTPQGASSLLNMINSPQVDSGIVGNMSQLLGGGGNVNQLVNTGSSLINSLLGSNAGPLGNTLASMSGLSGSSISKLLALGAPFLFGGLKKLVGERGLNNSGLMSLLGDQAKSVQSAIDPRLAQAMNLRLPAVSGATREVAAEAAGGFNKILPWLIGLLVLVPLLLWMSRSCSTKTAQEAANATSAAADATRNAAETTAQSAANAARSGAAALRSIQLPGGTNFDIPTGGFIDSLVAFLNGSAPAGQSFAFDAVTFESDSTRLASTSNDQLGQLAAVLKAYPTVVIAVEGHTDNTGDPAANKKLSEDRAAAVKDALVGMGVPAERVTSAGWGAEKPIASNDTEEGKLKNRRVEISISKR
jgi:outer membrane protein OmpA-like peptidoglycan-associated protein